MIFIDSLKRLYAAGRVSEEKLSELQTSGKITQEQYNDIKGE